MRAKVSFVFTICCLLLFSSVVMAKEFTLTDLSAWQVINGSPTEETVDGITGILLAPPDRDLDWAVGDYILFELPEEISSGTVTVDAKIRLNGRDRGLVITTMKPLTEESSEWVEHYSHANAYIAADQGQLKYFVGATSGSWHVLSDVNLFTWIPVRLEVDLDAKLFHFYLDGNYVGSFNFRLPEADSLAAIGFLLYQGTTPAQSAMVADVVVTIP